MSGKASSTIGFERRHNWALQAPDYATFDAWMRGDVREVVESILTHRNTNRGELPVPDGYYGQHASAVSEAFMQAARAKGTIVVDVRAPLMFAKGHVAGALSIPYQRDSYLVRLGAFVPAGASIIVYADTITTAEIAAQVARDAGYHVAGLSHVALTDAHPLPTISVADLHDVVMSGGQVIDVRDPHEHAKGVIDRAMLVPHLHLREALTQLPHEPLYVVCESGQRATISAAFLRAQGITVAGVVLPGGMSDYNSQYALASHA